MPTNIEEIRKRWSGVVWQRSRFVDKPQYANFPGAWKADQTNLERRTIRGPGVVGTPECNAVMVFSGYLDTEIIEMVAIAPTDIHDLLAFVDALTAERDALKARIEAASIKANLIRAAWACTPKRDTVFAYVADGHIVELLGTIDALADKEAKPDAH